MLKDSYQTFSDVVGVTLIVQFCILGAELVITLINSLVITIDYFISSFDKSVSNVFIEQFIQLKFPTPNVSYERVEDYFKEVMDNENSNINSVKLSALYFGQLQMLMMNNELLRLKYYSSNLKNAVSQYRLICLSNK